MTASPPSPPEAGGTREAGDTSEVEPRKPTSKGSEWSLQPQDAPQPRLAFSNSATEAGAEPADIDTTDLMIAIRRAAATLDADGMPRDAFVRCVAAEIDNNGTSQPAAKTIDNALRTASQRGIIHTEQGNVLADCRTIADYPRDLLKRTLLSVVGRTWTTRDEAITAANRHLGFERTGKKIRAAFKSALTGLLRQGDLEKDRDQIRRAR